jgi:hypothetical protein
MSPRARKTDDEPQPEAAAEEPSEKTVKLKYTGPPDQFLGQIGMRLETGESYDVPEDLAKSLVEGSAHWEK